MSSALDLSSVNPSVSRIFLVGMPGCGKSTVGKELARQLQYPFLDLDTLIEEQEGMAVPQVFEQRGQDYFRQAEARALRLAVASQEQMVLATGGGAPCFCDNMAFMVSRGIPVYLELSPAELVARLTPHDLQLRPLLRDKSDRELFLYLSETLTQRQQFYRHASCTVSAGTGSPAALAREIVHRLATVFGQVNDSI